jgi:hypothetical protein
MGAIYLLVVGLADALGERLPLRPRVDGIERLLLLSGTFHDPVLPEGDL